MATKTPSMQGNRGTVNVQATKKVVWTAVIVAILLAILIGYIIAGTDVRS